MADRDGIQEGKNFHLDQKANNKSFRVKGMEHCDWGLKHRLSRIFNPESGHTVMLAFDHGYIMGATSGLERLDITVPPLADHADVLMATRGALRSCISPTFDKAVALRVSGGSTVLQDDMSLEYFMVNMQESLRMDATCIAIQTYIGSKNEAQTLKNLNEAVNLGNQYGIPVLGVVGVGKEMART